MRIQFNLHKFLVFTSLILGALFIYNSSFAQKRTNLQTRLSMLANGKKSTCQCPENAIVISKQTLGSIDIADEGIQTGEAYCLKSLNLKMDDLKINGGKLILLPGTSLTIKNNVQINGGELDIRTGAALTTNVFQALSSDVKLADNSNLKVGTYNDFNGRIFVNDNSTIEVDHLLRLNQTNTIAFNSDSGQAVFSVYGEMKGNAVAQFMDTDINIHWEYIPTAKTFTTQSEGIANGQ